MEAEACQHSETSIGCPLLLPELGAGAMLDVVYLGLVGRRLAHEALRLLISSGLEQNSQTSTLSCLLDP